MTFESFFLVVLPGVSAVLFALAVVLFFVYAGIPWVQSLKYKNRHAYVSDETWKQLGQSKRLLGRIAEVAEEDLMVQVALGPKNMEEMNSLLLRNSKLEVQMDVLKQLEG